MVLREELVGLMKKRKLIILLLLAGAMGTAGCSKSSDKKKCDDNGVCHIGYVAVPKLPSYFNR